MTAPLDLDALEAEYRGDTLCTPPRAQRDIVALFAELRTLRERVAAQPRCDHSDVELTRLREANEKLHTQYEEHAFLSDNTIAKLASDHAQAVAERDEARARVAELDHTVAVLRIQFGQTTGCVSCEGRKRELKAANAVVETARGFDPAGNIGSLNIAIAAYDAIRGEQG